MADSKRESREVGFKVSDGCGNEACYCDGSCREGKARDLTIKVTADVNDAITGFKALSRELREATKAAREMESAYKGVEEAFKLTKPIAEKCGVSDTELLTALVAQMDEKEVCYCGGKCGNNAEDIVE